MERFNLVVVGAGSGGLVVAAGAAGLGARVALVERHRMGGDCLNTGCVPSKALLKAAKVVQQAREAGRFGLRGIGDPGPQDARAVLDYVRSCQALIAPHDSVERFRGLGIHQNKILISAALKQFRGQFHHPGIVQKNTILTTGDSCPDRYQVHAGLSNSFLQHGYVRHT